MHVYNFALKFPTMAEKTAKNLRGLFFATLCKSVSDSRAAHIR